MRRYAYLLTAHSSEGGAPSCVYYVCMARVNIYLPDELAEQVREADINVSAVARSALENELAARATNAWIARIRALPRANVSHEQVIAALDAAREEYDPL
jgi:post-segregation antitoxin (ccd killing protein)